MSASQGQDTEITLGTGKMLALFFALVGLCAAFFAMGYKMGRGSGAAISISGGTTAVAAGGSRPSAVKPAVANPGRSTDVAFYKSASQTSADNSTADAGASAASSDNSSAPADPAVAPPASGYLVQVAAVSRQEDGSALVDALKAKQYTAFSAMGPDKLYHVEVGPFADIKTAEDTRAKLINDGYNPILKK
jgi:DedD protein